MNDDTVASIAHSGYVVEQISDQFAALIKGQNSAFDELGLNVKDE